MSPTSIQGITPATLGFDQKKFPDWRPGQLSAAMRAAGSTKDVFLVDSPMGTGKSAIGVAAANLTQRKALYVVSTKMLQDQVQGDFPKAMVLKGRSNYQCNLMPRSFPAITAAECIHRKAKPCPLKYNSCTYEIEKARALAAPMCILNYAYLIGELAFVGRFAKQTRLLIADEVDCVEDHLMSHLQLVITQNQLDRLSVDPPKFKTKFEAWLDWAGPTLGKVLSRIGAIEVKIDSIGGWSTATPAELRELTRLNRLKSKLKFFVNEVNDTWVWHTEKDRWTFKPIWVSRYAESALWDHVDRTIGMSATILDPYQLAHNIGIKDFGHMQMSSLFDPERRLVYYRPVAKVTRKTKSVAYPRVVKEIDRILEEHPSEKVLIHTVSYELTHYVFDHSKHAKRFLLHSTADRAQKLGEFQESDKPLVLLSPSMRRGVDLRGDECRVVIVCKVPWANLGDPQISQRVYRSRDGQKWYAYRTVQELVQSTGRATRSQEDWSVSYVLDSEFSRLFESNRRLFPDWWVDALREV